MTNSAISRQIVVAITGASGARYAQRLVECLSQGDAHVHLVASPNGERLFREELDVSSITPTAFSTASVGGMSMYSYKDVGAKIASGSFHTDGMIICPCSGNTLAAVAAGLGDNLIARSAAVTLKENRRLVLVTREMPLTQIDLRNALHLSRAGATVCPASPGFYMLPETVDDLVDFVVGKLLDLVGMPHELNTRWASRLEPTGNSEDANHR